jgi:phosphoserine phosphatase RsbU/P
VHRDQAVLCIGDVAGKGLAGALLMSNLQAAVKAMAAEARYPQSLCARLNQLIRANVSPHKFITFFYGLLNTERHSLTYTNAGHNAPILLRSDGSIDRLDVGGPVLGVFPNEPYAQTNVSLAPGDRLVLFTDGLIEATNEADEEFGEARLINTLVQHRTLTAEALQERVLNAASQFCNSDFEDDATLVIVAAQ